VAGSGQSDCLLTLGVLLAEMILVAQGWPYSAVARADGRMFPQLFDRYLDSGCRLASGSSIPKARWKALRSPLAEFLRNPCGR
jgi:hypothetical protein